MSKGVFLYTSQNDSYTPYIGTALIISFEGPLRIKYLSNPKGSDLVRVIKHSLFYIILFCSLE